ILALLEKPPPQGYTRWTGPLLAKALGDVDVQYVWRFLREHSIDLAARKSWCESNDPAFAAKAADVVGGDCSLCRRKAFDPGLGAGARLSEAAERARLDRPQPRLQAARHHDPVRRARGRYRQDHRSPFQAPPPRRVSRLHEQPRCRLPGSHASRHPRQSQYAQEERALAQETPQGPLPFHPNQIVVAQSDRNWFSILQGQSLNGASFTAVEQLQEH